MMFIWGVILFTDFALLDGQTCLICKAFWIMLFYYENCKSGWIEFVKHWYDCLYSNLMTISMGWER